MLMPMPDDMFVALTWLAVVSAITPGPNNAMVASSGANFGYRRSVPHFWGSRSDLRFCFYARAFFWENCSSKAGWCANVCAGLALVC